MTPFDFLNSINYTKENLIKSDDDENEYNPFIVNRGLSFFKDTVLFANEMNRSWHLDNQLQYDFLRKLVRKNKRFPKWIKSNVDLSDIEILEDYYQCNRTKAISALNLLSKEKLDSIREEMATIKTSISKESKK